MMLRTESRRTRGSEGELYLALPPYPSSHCEARQALEQFFVQLLGPVPVAAEPTFFIAIGEALSNAIEHSGTSSFIEIFALVEDERVVVWIRDHGSGFVLPAVTLPANDSERGRGLPLMRICTDDFQIHSEPRVGTTVRLERRFAGTIRSTAA